MEVAFEGLGKSIGFEDGSDLGKLDQNFLGILKIHELMSYLYKKIEQHPDLGTKIAKRSQALIGKIIDNSKVTSDLLELLNEIKDSLGYIISTDNVKSLVHILECIGDSIELPYNKLLNRELSNKFGNISQIDLLILVSFFHDLEKNYMPAQFINDLSVLSGKNLSSHQKDSSDLFKKSALDKNTTVQKSLKNYYFKRAGVEKNFKDFVELISEAIRGHAGNTEFIQVDTSRAVKFLLSWVDDKFEGVNKPNQAENILNEFGKNVDIMNNFSNKLRSNMIMKCKKMSSIKDMKDYIKKNLVKKFLQNNIGKKINLKDIELDELNNVCDSLSTKIDKTNDISKILFDTSIDGQSQQLKNSIQQIIESKKQFLFKNKDSINKYLHPRSFANSYQEITRMFFNIIDIQCYADPKTAGFIKLIGVNPLSSLLSSPINSSLAILAEIRLLIDQRPYWLNSLNYFENMYNIGVYNICKLIKAYQKMMSQPVFVRAPQPVKDAGKTLSQAYLNCIKNRDTYEKTDQDEIKAYFVSLFEKICGNLTSQSLLKDNGADTLNDLVNVLQ